LLSPCAVALVAALVGSGASIAWSAAPRVVSSARRLFRAGGGFGARLAQIDAQSAYVDAPALGATTVDRIASTLATPLEGDAASLLRRLVESGLDELPMPGRDRPLERWQALAEVSRHDLSLAKLYEGHADALAIQHKLQAAGELPARATWGVWAAEAPGARVNRAGRRRPSSPRREALVLRCCLRQPWLADGMASSGPIRLAGSPPLDGC
jgi:hypothetical protein